MADHQQPPGLKPEDEMPRIDMWLVQYGFCPGIAAIRGETLADSDARAGCHPESAVFALDIQMFVKGGFRHEYETPVLPSLALVCGNEGVCPRKGSNS